ncbi:GntR family transcriptional regulator [Caldimonas aquatica]|uniref:GntR family transcriptional regulator n=1 Tax=Caldimonas aquatica TaxID=376175 RepID=A0ABY6MQG4_9BURK|nr:GntR family transcriptional regulator [Schlegelella aquatica]UZD53840.1 GntR family transcriptional regulator [Schlegelella aquatica]
MAKRSFQPPSTLPVDPADGAATRTLIEQTYTTLRDDIIEGRLAPDSRLRIEHLRQQYQVGAGTLREALTRLVSDALVVAEGQRGFRVAPIAIEDLEDITRLRVHIETDALRQSIRCGDDAWRARVTAAYEALSAEEQPVRPERRRQWEALNLRFHEALLSGHASPWTQRVLRLLARHSERYRSYAIGLPDSGRDVHAEHTEIYQLAISGQEARAALALEAHISATPYMLIRALREGRIVLPGARPPAAAHARATPAGAGAAPQQRPWTQPAGEPLAT